jgi:hypothetical protein
MNTIHEKFLLAESLLNVCASLAIKLSVSRDLSQIVFIVMSQVMCTGD